MSNVFDSALLPDTVSRRAETVLQNRLAPLAAFTRNFGDQLLRTNDTLQVPIASATSATSVNPATFEPGSSTTVDKATITLDHLVQFFGLSDTDIKNGRVLEQLIDINLGKIADKIFSVAITPVTTVNFGVAVVTTETITPGSGHLPTLWAAISKADMKSLIVNPTIYSGLIPTNTQQFNLGTGAYGFDGIYFANSFTGAVASLKGFAISNRAIGIASALPAIDEIVRRKIEAQTIIAIPGLGLSLAFNMWSVTSSRARQCTFELMFGSKAVLTSGTAALII